MITIEHDFDGTSVFLIDPTGEHEDIELIVDEEGIWMRQFNDDNQTFEVIHMNQVMFEMLVAMYDLEEGVYVIERNTE